MDQFLNQNKEKADIKVSVETNNCYNCYNCYNCHSFFISNKKA